MLARLPRLSNSLSNKITQQSNKNIQKRYGSDSSIKKASPVPFSPVYAAIPTPFAADGSLAPADMVHNIHKWNNTLLDGILVLGSTGEASSLSFKEKVEILQTVKKEASPRMQLFAGTGTSSLKETKDLTAIAQDIGYDAALIISPYFYISQLNDASLEAYFTQVADTAHIPIILYNNPRNSGVSMSVNLIKKLAQHPNIVGIKESSFSVDQISILIQETKGNDFTVLGASGATFLHNTISGSPGSISALATVVPNELVRIHELIEAKDFEQAAALQNHLTSLNYALTTKYGVPGLKYILGKMGFKTGPTRLPLMPLGEKDIASLDKLFQEYQL